MSIKFHGHVGPPEPHPATEYCDSWNEEFVKMPFSEFNLNDRNQVTEMINVK